MKREFMFPVEIWKSELNIDNAKLSNFILDLEKKTKTVKVSNVGGWQSKSDFIFLPELNELKNTINVLLDKVSKANAYKDNVSITFSNGWANINRYKDYNTNHQHPLSHWSSVYYVKIPENSGNLYFIDPKVSRTMIVEYPYAKNLVNPSQTPHIKIGPSEGLFVLFPSYLEHSVGPNMSNKPRISISINFILKKNK